MKISLILILIFLLSCESKNKKPSEPEKTSTVTSQQDRKDTKDTKVDEAVKRNIGDDSKTIQSFVCLQQITKKIAEKKFVFSDLDFLTEDDLLQEEVDGFINDKATKVSYFRHQESEASSEVTALEANYDNDKMKKDLKIEIEKADKEKSHLILEYASWDANNYYDLEKKFIIDDKCSISFLDMTIIIKKRLKDNQIQIREIYTNKNRETKRKNQVYNTGEEVVINFTQYMEELEQKHLKDKELKQYSADFLYLGDIESGIIQVDFDISDDGTEKSIDYFNDSKESTYNKFSIHMDMNSTKIEFEVLSSKETESVILKSMIHDDSSYAIKVPPHLFIKSDVVEKKSDIQYANNFKLEENSNLIIEAKDIEKNALLPQYFSVVQDKENQVVLSKKESIDIDHRTLLSSDTLVNDDRYLRESDFIKFDNSTIEEMREWVLSKNPQTRMEATYLALQAINEKITYDKDQLENDLTRTLSLEDIFDKKQGVCQHFALVATTLLRSMEIPTRMIQGLYLELDDKTSDYHGWIEVKLNNDEWLPLEPIRTSQKTWEKTSFEDYTIKSFNYIPLSEYDYIYEKGNEFFDETQAKKNALELSKKFKIDSE